METNQKNTGSIVPLIVVGVIVISLTFGLLTYASKTVN